MLAKLYRMNNIVELLIDKGAKTDLRDKQGKNADDYEKIKKPAFIKLFQ